jgi:hypothetical protein
MITLQEYFSDAILIIIKFKRAIKNSLLNIKIRINRLFFAILKSKN